MKSSLQRYLLLPVGKVSASLLILLFAISILFTVNFVSALEIGTCVDGQTYIGGEGSASMVPGCEGSGGAPEVTVDQTGAKGVKGKTQQPQNNPVQQPGTGPTQQPGVGPTQQPGTGPTQQPSGELVTTCKGQTISKAQLDAELRAAGYGGPWDTVSALAAYNRAACPTETVTTCKGQTISRTQLDNELRAAHYPGPWDTSSALAAYNRAACPSPVQTPAAQPQAPAVVGGSAAPVSAVCSPTFVGLNKGDTPTWDTLKKIVVPGEQVQVGAFANSSFTSRLSGSKTTLRFSGPESGTLALFGTFQPSKAGEYVIRGETKDDQGRVCSSGEARLEVSVGGVVAGPTTTTTVTPPPPTPTPVTVTVNVTGQTQTQTQTVTQGQPVAPTVAKVEPIKTLPKTGMSNILPLFLGAPLALGLKLIRFKG